MNIRPKTVRRLLYVVVACVLVAAAGLFVRQYKDTQKRARLKADRDAGVAAFHQGDYPKALELLKNYIRPNTQDADALLAFATSRSKIELPGGRHIPEAMGLFITLRSIKGDLPEITKPLLDLYTRADQRTETLDLANALLAKTPNDVDALRAKSIILARSIRYDDALAVSLQWNAAAPDDLQGQIQTYWLLHQTKTPREKIIQRYRDLLSAAPDNPRFQMLLGVAYGEAGETDKALQLLRAAAANPPADAQFVEQLARMFDQQGLFEDSRTLLQRAAAANPAEPAIVRILLQRLWQDGRHAEVLQHSAGVDPASASADSNVLAYAAMSLIALDRLPEARQTIAALAARTSDNLAAGWSDAIQTRLDSDSIPPPLQISRYQAAMSRGGENAIIRLWIGDAHFAMGETDLAVRSWRQSTELMPSWPAPHLQIARAMLSVNRPADAADAAADAIRCAPDQVAPRVTLALARYALVQQNPDPRSIAQLAALVHDIQRLRPSEPQTLALHADMLCRQDKKSDAVAAIRTAIGQSAEWDAGVLSRLLSVSREYGLGMEGDLLNATRAAAENQPEIALRHAIELDHAGRSEEGLRLLQDAARRASGPPAVAWQVVLAQYREARGDPDATASWVALGDANPDSFMVQALILRSAASAQADSAFYARTIDRVKALTGDDGTLWRYARARFLLSGQPGQRESAEAANLLLDLVRANANVPEYRVRLAQAQENLGRTAEAAEQLRAAAEMDPRSVAVQLELARLLQELGKNADARNYLERAARSPLIDLSHRVPLAQMLADEGQTTQAIAVLEQSVSRDVQAELLLADCYRRSGRVEEADAVFTNLLKQTAAPDVLVAAADFYATRGQTERAQQMIQRIELADLPQQQKHYLVGRFEEKHGSREAARQRFTAAAEESPSDAAAWRRLAAFLARQGDYAGAVAAADRGLEVVPGNAELQSLRLQADAMQRATASGRPNDFSPLVEALSRDRSRIAEAEALAAMQELGGPATTRPTAAKLARLRQSADRFPRFLPLQAVLARAYLQSDMIDDAAKIASRLLENLPGEPDAAALATTIFRAGKRWADMKDAATQWRKLMADNTRPADLAFAEACSNLGQAQETIDALQPHIVEAARNPEENATLLRLAATAMLAAGQPERAEDLIGPLLAVSEQARMIWLRVTADPRVQPLIAKEWLLRARAVLTITSVEETAAYARAAAVVATRYGDPAPLRDAIDLLAPHTTGETADAEAMFLTASLRMQLGQLNEAEKSYRAVLAVRPDFADARNDLAYLLLLRRGDLNEAAELARGAVAASPQSATMHETLARILAEQGDRPAALAAYDSALALDPTNLDALIGKAYLLRQQGHTAETRRMMARIQPLLADAPPLAAPVRAQLEELRSDQTRGE